MTVCDCLDEQHQRNRTSQQPHGKQQRHHTVQRCIERGWDAQAAGKQSPMKAFCHRHDLVHEDDLAKPDPGKQQQPGHTEHAQSEAETVGAFKGVSQHRDR
jgi:hypothetical protein